MEYANKAMWDEGFAKNDDPYGRAVYVYAERWADLMEAEMAKGATLEDCVKQMSRAADEGVGITGFMYGCAVSILAGAWKHGEALRRWHNLDTQIGTEGEKANKEGGTLNPALLNIATN